MLTIEICVLSIEKNGKKDKKKEEKKKKKSI